MPDTRDQLAAVIRDHQFVVDLNGDPYQVTFCECQRGRSGPDGWMLQMEPSDYPAHVADVLFSLPGIAVVALSEPDGPMGFFGDAPRGLAWRRDTRPQDMAGGIATVGISGPGAVVAAISCISTADDARWAAASLLAAAVLAERAED